MTSQRSSLAEPTRLELLKRSLQESIAVKQAILGSSAILNDLVTAANRMAEALRRGGKILFFGNGGSASDSLHLAGELVGRFGPHSRLGLPALALPANAAVLTAIGNDFGFEEVFSRQIEALGNSGDVAVGISTSGRSKNVLKGLEMAKKKGLFAVGLTGENGGDLQKLADLCLCVPSSNTQRIQESHILIGHALCELIEDQLLKQK